MVAKNVSLPSDTYVPILKGKRGECDAISTCSPHQLLPLVEISNFSNAKKYLSSSWNHAEDSIWIQGINLGDSEDLTFANNFKDLFEDLTSYTQPVPVATISETNEMISVLAEIISSHKCGLVIRIDVEDILEEPEYISQRITSLFTNLEISYEDTFLVLDAGILEGSPIVQSALAKQSIQQISPIEMWKSVVVSFSAFPTPISNVAEKNKVTSVPRNDAAAFNYLQSSTTQQLIFSDYAIGTPRYADAPYAPIPNMKYAYDSFWAIHRAESKNTPSPQYRRLAQEIVNSPYYSGSSFSSADKMIYEIANGFSGPGNATTHVKIGVSRHIHVVLSRLSTLGVP